MAKPRDQGETAQIIPFPRRPPEPAAPDPFGEFMEFVLARRRAASRELPQSADPQSVVSVDEKVRETAELSEGIFTSGGDSMQVPP